MVRQSDDGVAIIIIIITIVVVVFVLLGQLWMNSLTDWQNLRGQMNTPIVRTINRSIGQSWWWVEAFHFVFCLSVVFFVLRPFYVGLTWPVQGNENKNWIRIFFFFFFFWSSNKDLCGTHMYQLVGAPFDFRPQERKKNYRIKQGPQGLAWHGHYWMAPQILSEKKMKHNHHYSHTVKYLCTRIVNDQGKMSLSSSLVTINNGNFF